MNAPSSEIRHCVECGVQRRFHNNLCVRDRAHPDNKGPLGRTVGFFVHSPGDQARINQAFATRQHKTWSDA